ncbi:S41 family peptidase [Alkalilimnicola sp. S0819]|uniref:S41 family peptidase n=1 Tax=Alkalilimnicola sp. S0819 TaxID=2613922 RepID=UPI001261F375|nr:S41 family peptidase [Alkalilimnicola sp. S0819]KAB7622721.1 S41 family peptidase [Alkalilimnicola sp. S0819]MPQ17361.1 PDZ domain-containing protein [Alkalilimnicola sp. S0819]
MTIRKTLISLASGAVLALGTLSAPSWADMQQARAEIPLDELRAFTEVYSRIKRDYVEGVDDKTLLEHAVRGMLQGLDPHSAYMDEEQYQDMRVSTRGEFGGLGIEVSMENGFVRVVSPIDDTPASRAGLRPGDLITRLGNEPVKGMTLSDAVALMRGEPGSSIRLTVIRDGEEGPLSFELTRAVIKVESVKSRLLEDDYGYVRISNFQSRTGEQTRNAVKALRKEAGGSLKGLVLDLRNNPGGVLRASVQVADTFLEDGDIVATRGREDGENYKATRGDLLDGAPMVVLVNAGSASASEIVAGALQDHGRAVIMGAQTFGKGSVQTILPLAGGTAMKMTTARYYTPKGRSIQAEGITPDIKLSDYKLSRAEVPAVNRLREADLRGHLSNPDAGKAHESAERQAGAAQKDLDYALTEAVNLLKGLNIMAARR